MKSTEATVSDRKSGAAKGSAVRPGSRSKVWVSLVLTHPLGRGIKRACCTAHLDEAGQTRRDEAEADKTRERNEMTGRAFTYRSRANAG
jgi:hypothetical protein